MLHKAQLDRLVGQIECLEPQKNWIIVVLCGDTNPALTTRFKERYKPVDRAVITNMQVALAVKEAAAKVKA